MTNETLEKAIKLKNEIDQIKAHKEMLDNIIHTYPTSLEVYIGYGGNKKIEMSKSILNWQNLNTFIYPYWNEVKTRLDILEYQYKEL